MTTKEIKETLDKLHYAIEYQRHVNGNDDKIRVRMGRSLAAWVKIYANYLIINHADDTEINTIWGFPLEIDNYNPMCLEILVVEKVPIYKEKSSCQKAATKDDQNIKL